MGSCPPTPLSPKDRAAGASARRWARLARTCAARSLMGLVRLYQLTLSPLVGNQCRFYPTCSHYALRVLADNGALKGSWLTIKRLLKCHPFHPGGVDLPPGSEG